MSQTRGAPAADDGLGFDVALSALDSDRFGVSIARADAVAGPQVAELTRRCLRDGIEMVIARCRADDFSAVHALERAGYLLMESLVDYVGPVVDRPASPLVRVSRPGDLEAITDVARAAFADYAGHYHADPRLPDRLCVDAYVSWARRCATGEAAENVVVAEIDGEVVGFQAHRCPAPGVGQLLLVCVDPAARGRGVYHALGSEAQRWSAQRGCRQLLAICHQANLASHRVFIGLGLRPQRTSSTFHGWADDLRIRGRTS